MKLGLISDTHGHLDPQVAPLFAGVEHILHAGDIGSGSINVQLEQIAPVTAVLGNNDAGLDFRETETVALAGLKFLVHHILTPVALTPPLQARLDREQPDIVVFGHTHQPQEKRVGRILFVNPGYAGQPRFNLARSVALLHCADGRATVEFKPL